MAYLGSTQSSSIANPPILLAGGMGAGAGAHIDGSSGVFQGNAYPSTSAYNVQAQFGQRLWMYHTTDMTSAPWNTAYFTDAGALGMRPGDVVIMVRQGTTVTSSQYLTIATVGSLTTAGAAALSTQSILTSS